METPKNKSGSITRLYATSLTMALLSLLLVQGQSRAQSCPQLAGQTYYSRVINGTFLNNGYLQADYDPANENLYVCTTDNSSGNDYPFLAQVHYNSVINWSMQYQSTQNVITQSVKKASNGDEIIAGTTVNSLGNNVVFVERLNSTGGLLWQQYYDQNTTNVTYNRVLVTETSTSNDIIVAASSWTGSDDLILIRLSSSGTLKYYDDHPLYTPTSLTSRYYPWFNAIAATNDDGYVLVGSTGHNYDFYAATVYKYDASYGGGGSPTLNWDYVYRHPLLVYDLTTPGDRSSSYACGVVIDPSTANVVVVGRQGDNDNYGTNTTYQNGFILVLSGTGVLQSLNKYVPASTTDFITFNAVKMTGSDYIISGFIENSNNSNASKSLLLKVSSSTLNPAWAYIYGTGTYNVGESVFPSAYGYLMVNESNDKAGVVQPQVIATDANGNVGNCNTAYSLTNNSETNDQPILYIGPSTSATPTGIAITQRPDCQAMYHLCGDLCAQIAPKVHYSRVINDNFTTNNWLHGDYDATNNNGLVATTYTGSGSNDIFWSNVAVNGTINASAHYNVTGNENAVAIKHCANGDMVIAGNTIGSSGNHILFVMRTNAYGTPIWYRYFDQSSTDIFQFIQCTETQISNDIVVAGCTNSGNNDIVMLRLSSAGTLQYYDDHGIYAAGNTTQLYPYIKDIASTYDDGYVIVGNTGHNYDFYAAAVLKFDANYNINNTHTPNWSYIYRRELFPAIYNLTVFGERSAAFARGVTEDPSTHDIIAVGMETNCDQYTTNATFQYGFCIKLNSAGILQIRRLYNSNFMTLNGVTVDGSNYVMVGALLTHPNTGPYQTLIMKVDNTTLVPAWAELYGTNTVNASNSIFKTPNGYLSIGVSNDLSSPTQPNFLSVNFSGQAGQCYKDLSTSAVADTEDIPSFTQGNPVATAMSSTTVLDQDLCEQMYDLCSSSTAPELSVAGQSLPKDMVNAYPNPASDKLNVDVNMSQSTRGRIVVKDLLGNEILSSGIDLAEGSNHFEINVAVLKPGIYFVQVVDENNLVNHVSKIQKL